MDKEKIYFKNGGYLCAILIYRICNGLLKLLQLVLFQWKVPQNPETILLYRTGHLGDTLCAVPAIQAVRKRFPHARLHFMTNLTDGQLPFPKDVLDGLVECDEIIAYDPRRIAENGYRRSLLDNLKSKRINLLVYLGQNMAGPYRLIRDMFFFKAAQCKAACGFSVTSHRFFAASQRLHRRFDREPERLMKIIRPLGASQEIQWSVPEISLPFDLAASTGKRPVIGIHPWAKFPANRWPAERFVQVARYLQERHNAFILILGGADMQPQAQWVGEQLLQQSFLNLSGKTGYLETMEILRRCRLLVSNDSGPVHMAAAVGTPVVGVYSARNFPNTWNPWGDQHEILRKDVPCQICFLETCPIMICTLQISTEEVIAACERILNRKSAPQFTLT